MISKKAILAVMLVGVLAPQAAVASDSGSCIASMSASLDSAVLIAADSTEVTVISSPTPILLVGDEGELKGVVSVTIPDGSPTSFVEARITLSNISFSTFQDCATGSITANPSTLTDLAIEFEEDDENDDIEEITSGSPVSLEIEFSPEDGLVSDGAGCFTGDFVADPAPAFEAELEDDNNEEEDLELAGTVVSVGASDFVLDVNGTQFTITVDASTQFEDIGALSELAAGDLVKAEVETQPDGTLLATEVELLFDESGDAGATGRIACVDTSSGPASAIAMVFAPSTPDHDFPALTLTVNLNAGTTFKVNKGNINTSGFTFDASNLSPGQRLTAAGTTVSGADPPQVDANKLILKRQEVDGRLVDGSVNTGASTFQLTITSASDVLLTEPITVKVSPNTKFAGRLRDLSGLNTTDTYQVKGLLMRDPAGTDSTDVVFLAKKIKKKTGNAP